MTKHTRLQRWLLAFAVFMLASSLLSTAAPPGDGAAQASSPEHYLIISADLFADHLDDFVALKESQGFFVTLATLSQTGVNPEDITNYIQDLHDSQRINYVLLVGDDNFVPIWPSRYSGTGTDYYYTIPLDESSYVPLFPLGRLPVRNTTDLENWISKMVDYEQASGLEAWAKGASFIASSGTPFITKAEPAHNHVIENHSRPAGFSGNFPISPQPGGDKLYAGTYYANHDHLVSALNSGRQIAVYFGSGNSAAWLDPVFTQADVRAMTGPPIPLVVGLADFTASFSTLESLADTWVTQPHSGALSYIGLSTSNDAVTNGAFEEKFFDELFSTNLGEAFRAGLAGAAFSKGCFSWNACIYREIYQLFGDPSMTLILEPKPGDYSLASQPAHVGACYGGVAITEIEARGRFDFDTLVTLSSPGLPAGLSVSFDPISILPGSISTVTLTANNLAPGDYPMTVFGDAATLVRQTGLVFSVHETAPEIVSLQSPAAFTPNAPLRPEFSWGESSSALDYDLEIATDHLFENIILSQYGLTEPRYTPEADFLPGTTYWWWVRANNACGSSDYSLPRRFTTRGMPGQCAGGGVRQIIYSTNFDTDPTGWLTPGNEPYRWARVSAFSNSPPYAYFASSRFSVGIDQNLVSPEIQLPGLDQSPIELIFWNRRVFGNLDECTDGGLLDYSLKEGLSWSPIPEENILISPYDNQISSAHKNPFGNQRAWCGDTGWSKAVVRLDEYLTEPIILRWRLGTDEFVPAGDGWFVDDVSIESCIYPPAPSISFTPATSQRTGLAGETLTHTLELTNTGPQTAAFDLTASGWSWEPVVTPSAVSLAAGQSAAVAVSVSIPAGADPGSADLATLVAVDHDDHAVHAAAQLETRASPYRLTLACLPPALAGYAGLPIIFTARVTNTGVSGDTVTLNLIPPAGWLFELPSEPFNLAPGETRDVPVKVFVPEHAEGTPAQLTLSAASLGGPGAGAEVVVPVEVHGPKIVYLPLVSR